VTAFVPTYDLPSVNRQILLGRRPDGIPLEADFMRREASIPEIAHGQFLVRNLYLSVDPAQRGWASDVSNYSTAVQIGDVMRALAVGAIVDSKNPAFPAGAYVYGWFGWQDYAAASANDVLTAFAAPVAPLSAYAGLFGINGLTADISLSRYGHVAPGDTVLVSTAAGAVGSLVCQLAKAAGAYVVGLTGSDAKCRKLLDVYGLDRALNYHVPDLDEGIAAAAPEGVNLFFDSTGGPVLDMVLRRMAVAGRLIQCGTASIASWSPLPLGPRNEREILTRRLSWNGFVVFDHLSEFNAAISRLQHRMAAGQLHFEEHILQDFGQSAGALELLYSGRNEGKLLVWTG